MYELTMFLRNQLFMNVERMCNKIFLRFLKNKLNKNKRMINGRRLKKLIFKQSV